MQFFKESPWMGLVFHNKLQLKTCWRPKQSLVYPQNVFKRYNIKHAARYWHCFGCPKSEKKCLKGIPDLLISSVPNPGFSPTFYYPRPTFFQLPNLGFVKNLELLLHSNISNSDNTEVADRRV